MLGAAARHVHVRAAWLLVVLAVSLLVAEDKLGALAQQVPASPQTSAYDAVLAGSRALRSVEKAHCVIRIKGPGTGASWLGRGTGTGVEDSGQGASQGGPIESASIDCADARKGGRVLLAVNQMLLGPFASRFKGVDIVRACPGVQQSYGCLLTVCGDADVEIFDSTIEGVKGARVALCVVGRARVILQNVTISQNHASAVVAFDQSFVELGRVSGITTNMVVRDDPRQFAPGRMSYVFGVGVSAVDEARVLVTGRTAVAGNTGNAPMAGYPDQRDPCNPIVKAYNFMKYVLGQQGWWNGGTGVVVSGNATMVLNGTLILNNRAEGDCAGGLVAGHGTLVVTGGSSISRNTASVSGGGLCARDHGHLDVGGSDISNNLCGIYGCGVLVDGSATAIIKGPVTISRNFFLQNVPGQCDKLCLDRDTYQKNGDVTGGGAVAVSYNASVLLEGPVDIVDNAGFGFGDGVLAFHNASVQIKGGVNFTRPSRRSVVSTPGWDVTTTGSAMLSLHDNVVSDGQLLNVCNASIRLGSDMCPPGTYATASGCTCCAADMYDFSTAVRRNATCSVCPANAVCTGNKVAPKPGYWKSSMKSVQIHPCPMGNTSCRGGEDTGDSTCMLGYTGTLCGVCASSYGITVPFKCMKCLPARQQLLLYSAMFGGSLVLITYTVHATWNDNQQGDKGLRISDLIKVPVQFLQYLVILGGVSAPWPAFLTTAFTTAAVVFGAAGGQSSSLDCWVKHTFPTHKSGQLSAPIMRQLVLVIVPLIVLAIVLLLVALSHVARRVWSTLASKGRRGCQMHSAKAMQLLSRLHVAALVVAFFAYPTLVKSSLSWFACLRVDYAGQGPYPEHAVMNHSAGYWVLHMDQACFSGPHRLWAFALGIPAAVLVCCGAPVAIWLFLWRNTSRASEPHFQERYGFLYRNFRVSCYWWEAVWAVQTVSLTAVSVFHHSLGAYHALLLMSLSLMVSLGLQVWKRPYEERLLHRLHLSATLCLIANVWLALNMFALQNSALHTVLGVAMVVVDTVFVMWCVFRIVQLAHHTWKPVRVVVQGLQRCCGAGADKHTGTAGPQQSV